MLTKKSPKIYFEKTGNGKPLILIHGNKEDHHIFDGVIPLLENDFTVYAVDSRCHGESESVKEIRGCTGRIYLQSRNRPGLQCS